MSKIQLLLGLMTLIVLSHATVRTTRSQNDEDSYVITEARLKEIRSQFMYWFFDSGGINNEGDWQPEIQNISPQIHKNLNLDLPFFGFRFNYTRLSLNGYLEFSDPPERSPKYPLVFPTKNWPTENDPSFIGMFYSKCRIGSLRNGDLDKRKPGVYFRTERNLHERTDQFGVELRERTKWDIREGIIGAETFNPKHVIIVTWKNVSFAGGIDAALSTTNTFQMVLVTDEVFTYAIFNYGDLQWTTHTEAGGDSATGQGGIPAFVGFNAGNGTRSYEYAPFSQRSTIRGLIDRGWANGFKGRHIFRLDENILRSSCNEQTVGAISPFEIAPKSGNMLGGTVVNITGPCFNKSDNVKCYFDTKIVSGIVVNRNRAICVQPQLFAEGDINLAISINGGRPKWTVTYFIEKPDTATERIFFDNDAVHEKNPSKIVLRWNKRNLTSNDNANIKISLWGYRETTSRTEFLYIDQIATGLVNSGNYTIVTENYRLRNNANLTDVHFGVLKINLTEPLTLGDSDALINPILWSRPIPLAWYFKQQWERKHGQQWSEQICNSWIASDRQLPSFTQDMPKCPCTLPQALSNKGRYLPDPQCDKDSNLKCLHHRGAVHCVQTGPLELQKNFGHSEQQCCYNKNGDLMLSHDKQWGSSPKRSSSLGTRPWQQVLKVPSLSQWYHDIAPKYFCCLWQNETSDSCETLRLERRPSQDCVSYDGPSVAGIFGDPHVMTFNDLQYTFNGKGEFVLLRANSVKSKLDIQGRFEQMPRSKNEEVKGTQLTSVVARGDTSTVIEVRLRPQNSQWRYRLDVFVNKRRAYFDNPALKFQHYPGVIVYTPTNVLNQSEVIVMFDSGAGLEVVENKGYMTTRVYLPETFKNKTRGLLGNWSSNPLSDLITPEGHIIPPPTANGTERIHYDFGLAWMLEDVYEPLKGESLFFHDYGRNAKTFNNRTYRPEFEIRPKLPNNSPVLEEDIDWVCGNDPHCFYDYAVTMNEELALFTLNYKSSLINLKEINRKKVVSCGALETPKFGRKDTFLTVLGTKVTFECDEGYLLFGDESRVCTKEGEWDVGKFGYTKCLKDNLKLFKN